MDKLYFDIETTGPDASKDRIVELAIKIIANDGKIILQKSKRYNPGIPILPQATEVHGISDRDVVGLIPFKEDAQKLKKIFENKIIITYNGMIFDVPILMNEFDRAGVEVNLSGKFVDVLQVERKLQSNKLSDVYKRYTGKDLTGAHEALADINATEVVLDHQINRLAPIPGDKSILDALIELSGTTNIADFYGKFKYDDEGYLIFNFGKKCKGKRVLDEPAYADWMLKENFPSQVKNFIRQERIKATKKQFAKPVGVPRVASLREELTGESDGYTPLTHEDDLPF